MKQCSDCCYRDNTSFCTIFKQSIKSQQVACPAHKTELFTCCSCGQPIPAQVTWAQKDNGDWLSICDRCASLSGHCPTCANGGQCFFETDPVALPKNVVKTIRQGNAQIQMQVPNPERIEKTCKAKCKCFSEENGCQRQNNTCANWSDRLV